MIDLRKETTPSGVVRDVWSVGGGDVGSISNLSKALGLNVETHDIGLYLQNNHGFRFTKDFEEA